MYYGNPSATSYSNGTNTFLFFDDFSGILSNLWTSITGANNSNGICTITRTGGVNASISSKSSFATNTLWRSRLKSAHINNASYIESFGLTNATGPNYYRAYYCYSSYNLKYTQYAPSAWNAGTAIGGWAADTYAIQQVKRNGTTSTISSVNDANEVTISANIPTGNMYCNIDAVTYDNSSLSVDWVFCAQWLATEPTWGTWDSTSTDFINGYIDELRVSKGVAMWTSNFIPPTNEYSNDQPILAKRPLCNYSGTIKELSVGDGLDIGMGGEYQLTYSDYINVDFTIYDTQSVILTGNVIFNLSNLTNGKPYRLIVIQDSIGGRTVSFTNSIRWPSGVVPTPSSAGGLTDIYTFIISQGIISGDCLNSL
jgi:hypothetical protein